MFQRLYELSHCLPARAAWERLNEAMPDLYDRGLAMTFDDQGAWTGVKTIHGNDGVVYRSGPPNGTDLTPCCKLAKDTANRLLKAINNLSEYEDLPDQKRAWLQSCAQYFDDHKEAIWAEVTAKEKQAGIDGKEHRGYVFLACDAGIEAVYGWPEAKESLVQSALEPFAKGGKREGHCSVCSQPAHAVYGNFSVLACYNLDKPGSIAGGFQKERAHLNLPVCGECAVALAEAFTFAEIYLTSSMAGQTYMILPYANAPDAREELFESLREHPDRYRLGTVRDLVAEELALVDEFADRGDQLAFALIFFKAENAAWRVQAEVQQLLPSRLRALNQAARQLTQAEDLATEDKDKTRIKPFLISAQTFKHFSGSAEKPSADTLRAWLVALFAGHAIDDRHFLHHLVSKIINTGKSKPDFFPWTVRQAWGLYRYARLTGLIEPDSTAQETVMQEAVPNSAYGRYVKAHQDFFCKPELVVAFLTGCYASQVASVQRKERGSDPFTKKFVGRLLARQHLRRLYREGHDKLAQYGKLGYVAAGLDPDLAQAWVACGKHWSINDEEATFAFTIGYSLAYRIHQLDSATDSELDPKLDSATDTQDEDQ